MRPAVAMSDPPPIDQTAAAPPVAPDPPATDAPAQNAIAPAKESPEVPPASEPAVSPPQPMWTVPPQPAPPIGVPPAKPRKVWFAWLRKCPPSLMVMGLIQLFVAPLNLFATLPAILAIMAPMPVEPTVGVFVGNDVESRAFWIALGAFALPFTVLTILAPYHAMKGSRIAARWFVASAWIQLAAFVPIIYGLVLWIMPGQLREIDAMQAQIPSSIIESWYTVIMSMTLLFAVAWLIALLWVLNRRAVREYLARSDDDTGAPAVLQPPPQPAPFASTEPAGPAGP